LTALHLVDASLYIFRAYHSLPPMQTPEGMPCGAAYGFGGMLVRWLGEVTPARAACVFDDAMTSFRNALEPGYKAGRTEAPADLEPQFALCREVAEALGLAALSAPDFEADDVIAALAEQEVGAGGSVVVVSADKDLAQLVREDGRVVVFDFARAQRLDADAVRARFGVAPGQIPDWLGLVGDAVDNLPGVPGIGPRTAAALLAAFGRIEAIPADASGWRSAQVRGADRLARLVDQHRARALRTRELATLRRDVPGLPRELGWRGPDPARIAALCERLGWRGFGDRALRLGARTD